jgi:cysteine desulfurase
MVLTLESSHDPIYLDHNATTPLAPEVLDAMLPFLRGGYGNPSSEHALGRRAHQAVENGRQQVASLIGAAPDEVIFTSGGTESNNIAIRGTAADAAPSRRRIPPPSGPASYWSPRGG